MCSVILPIPVVNADGFELYITFIVDHTDTRNVAQTN